MPPPTTAQEEAWRKAYERYPELQKAWGAEIPVNERGNFDKQAQYDYAAAIQREAVSGEPISTFSAASVKPVDWGQRIKDVAVGAGSLATRIIAGIPDALPGDLSGPFRQWVPGAAEAERLKEEARQQIPGDASLLERVGSGLLAEIAPELKAMEAVHETTAPARGMATGGTLPEWLMEGFDIGPFSTGLYPGMTKPWVKERARFYRKKGLGPWASAGLSYEDAVKAGKISGFEQFVLDIGTSPEELIPGVGVASGLTKLGTTGLRSALRQVPKTIVAKPARSALSKGAFPRYDTQTGKSLLEKDVPVSEAQLAETYQRARNAETYAQGPRAKIAILERRHSDAQQAVINIEEKMLTAPRRLDQPVRGTAQDQVIRNEVEYFLETADDQLAAAKSAERDARMALKDARVKAQGKLAKEALAKRDEEIGRTIGLGSTDLRPARRRIDHLAPVSDVEPSARATGEVLEEVPGAPTTTTRAAGEAVQEPSPFNIPDGPRLADPSGSSRWPPTTDVGKDIPSQPPEDILRRIQRQATLEEKQDETLLRLHAGALRAAENTSRIFTDAGNKSLKSLGIGKIMRGRLVPLPEEVALMDELFNALHNPSKVASGEIRVPKGLEHDYLNLRRATDLEEAMRIDFDPNMATVDDYFYRGWKPSEEIVKGTRGQPRVGAKPGFKLPRVDATYQEMRQLGFEPLFWNPYEQLHVSKMMGIRYREQIQLIDDFKQSGLAQPFSGGSGIKGWRTPDIGPAFNGKPFTATLADGTTESTYTRRWVVPDDMADRLENIYGKAPSISALHPFGRQPRWPLPKEIDLLKVIDIATFIPKRIKLFGSIFQQKDFLTRNLIGTWTEMVDALRAGQPITAAKALAVWPKSAYTIIKANVGPGARNRIRIALNSTESILPDRPGVHLNGIMKAGLSNIDATLLPQDIDKVVRLAVQDVGLTRIPKGILRQIGELESAMRRGLFEGVYPAAQITDIQNNIAPMMARKFPNLTDESLNGMIARITNIKYSTIPADQSVIQHRVIRESLRRLLFSVGESEGLLRQATGAIRGPNAAFWRKHWIGSYLALIAVANTIHFASTGKPLPADRYVPIAKDGWGPLPFGYNRDFALPNIPFTGRTSTELALNVVDQMDTVFRILDPKEFLAARESVPVRAGFNQLVAKDFYGRPINQVGPAGMSSRLAQAINDIFVPIGVGTTASQLIRELIPGGEQLIGETEGRIGRTGQLLQSAGFNIQGETTGALLERASQTAYGVPFEDIWPFERKSLQYDPLIATELQARQATSMERGGQDYFYKISILDAEEQAQLEELALNKAIRRKRSEARSEYYNIVGKFAVLRSSEAEKAFGKKGREFDETEKDPLKRALAEYYKAQTDAKTPAGLFDSDKYQADLQKLHAKWTDEQKLYVSANTNMRPIPQRLIDDRILSNRKVWEIQQSEQARATQQRRRRQAKQLQTSR